MLNQATPEDFLDWNAFHRYVTLGSQLGLYETSSFDPFRIPAPALDRCLRSDGLRAVRHAALALMDGHAARPEAALFVLAKAIAQGSAPVRREALELVPGAARSGQQLFQLLDYLEVLAPGDRAVRAAIAQWYAQRSVFELVSLLLRTPPASRTHREALGLAQAKPPTAAHAAFYRFVLSGVFSGDTLEDPGLELLSAHLLSQTTNGEAVVAALLRRWPALREGLPDRWLSRPAIWRELLPGLSTDAIVEWIPKVAGAHALEAGDPAAELLARRLQMGALGKSRQAPFAALTALGAVQDGCRRRGLPASEELEAALLRLFHHRLLASEPVVDRLVIAIDPAASSSPAALPDLPGISPRTALAALALTVAAASREARLVAFGRQLETIELLPGESIEALLAKLEAVAPGPPDGGRPLEWADTHELRADAFLVLSGTAPHASALQPERALADCRSRTGRSVKWIGVSCGWHRLCDAPPIDPDMLEIRGFDPGLAGVVLGMLGQTG